jgi:hypothetical protein
MKLLRHAAIRLVPYLMDRMLKFFWPTKPKHAWGDISDHYEPLLNDGLGNLFHWTAEETDRRGAEIDRATAWQMYQTSDALIDCRVNVPASPVCNKEASQ